MTNDKSTLGDFTFALVFRWDYHWVQNMDQDQKSAKSEVNFFIKTQPSQSPKFGLGDRSAIRWDQTLDWRSLKRKLIRTSCITSYWFYMEEICYSFNANFITQIKLRSQSLVSE